MLSKLLWVCLAGAVGCGTRYLIGVWASQRFGADFPYGTLIVNVLGCFLIAAILQTALDAGGFSDTVRLALSTGFLGGLTTYSSFAYETVRLARDGGRYAALLNFGLTTSVCFAAVLLGVAAASLWAPPAAR